jgi:AcrR family transcriptional regulator
MWKFVYTVHMSLHREQILEQACDLFVAEGLDGLSMRKLARSVGVTAPALYRHYESKEKVILDLIGEAFKTFSQYLHRGLQAESPELRFSMTGRNYLAFALEHPQFYELLHISPSQLGVEELPTEASSHACAAGQFLVDRVREGMECGMLTPGDAESVARTIWAHAHGMISIYHRGLLRMDEVEFKQFFLESSWRLMGGIGVEEFVRETEPEARRAALSEWGVEEAAVAGGRVDSQERIADSDDDIEETHRE